MTATLSNIRILAPFGSVAAYGSERANLRILQELKREGATIRILTRIDADPTLKNLVDAVDSCAPTALWGPLVGRNMAHPVKFFKALTGIFTTSTAVAKAMRRFKPTHLYFGNPLFFFYSWPAIAMTRQPVIYRVGDAVVPGPWSWFFKYIISRKAKRVICISEFILKDTLGSGSPPNKTSLIYCMTPHAHISLGPSKYRLQPNQYVVSIIGQVTRMKGVHHFVDAAIHLLRKYAGAIFYIAGDYSYNNPFAKELIKKVVELGLQEKIIFLGYLDDASSLIAETDILCVPSDKQEPLGNIVLEGKAAGVPAVVFPDGGLPEMIHHRVDGYICESKTHESLIAGIEYFLSDEARLIAAKHEAALSAKKFSPELVSKQWVDVFQ